MNTHDTSFDRHSTDFEKHQTLIEVRCPFKRMTGKGKEAVCAQLIIRVHPGSAGQAYCRFCKRNFEFNVAG